MPGATEPIPITVGSPPPTLDFSETRSESLGCGITRRVSHQRCESKSFGRRSENSFGSLNADPYNTQSEELAIAECARGLEVRRMWSEKEMVCSFGGRVFPGTPDGMFETWEGELTCVQVVRVPIVKHMRVEEMQEVLFRTVLTKVVKSQSWLRATHTVPFDFVIFCWLPFSIPDSVAEHNHELMRRVQVLDPRFSLRLRVPAIAGSLFPALFAHQVSSKTVDGVRSIFESDISTYNAESESEGDEESAWDITWAWEEEFSEAKIYPSEQLVEAEKEKEDSSSGEDEEDFDGRECEWDLTWNWDHDNRTCKAG